MAKLGIVASEDAFYSLLFEKWKEYLHRLPSSRQLIKHLGKDLDTEEELREHMEEIKIYVRGHNLFNLFYGPYKKQEQELLKAYISLAPKEDFRDILEPIERIPFFENRKKNFS